MCRVVSSRLIVYELPGSRTFSINLGSFLTGTGTDSCGSGGPDGIGGPEDGPVGVGDEPIDWPEDADVSVDDDVVLNAFIGLISFVASGLTGAPLDGGASGFPSVPDMLAFTLGSRLRGPAVFPDTSTIAPPAPLCCKFPFPFPVPVELAVLLIAGRVADDTTFWVVAVVFPFLGELF